MLTEQQTRDLRDDVEAELNRAADSALQRFLATLRREVLARVKAAASSTSSGASSTVRPGQVITAAAAQDPLTLGEAMGWWQAYVRSEVVAEVRKAWRRIYISSVPGETITATSLDGLDDYMARVTDRLVRGITPGIAEDSFDQVRISVARAAADGWSRSKLAADIAARVGWETDGPYWRAVLQETDAEIDFTLDRFGPRGSLAREMARFNDPEVADLREQRNEAIRFLDGEKSYWQNRATLIARTEATGAHGYAANRALIDEGFTHKRWLATNDSRTRPDHAAADGQVVSVNQAFVVGGYTLQFPGDPSAPVGEIANCRCTIVGEDAPTGEPPSPDERIKQALREEDPRRRDKLL